MVPVQVSLACWPFSGHLDAALKCLGDAGAGTPGLSEPLWGAMSADHVQIVPQCRGHLDEALCERLTALFPATRFRLHANVRVRSAQKVIDLSEFGDDLGREWFAQAARISRFLGAPAYSAHSGRRAHASLAQIIEASRRLSDWFDCPVAIEGQYPTRDGGLLVDSWEEYRAVFEAGAFYAIDLSHINILARHTRRKEQGLLQDMLACERCIEIHVSDNNGWRDQHTICHGEPWWYTVLVNFANPKAVVFSEGNHRVGVDQDVRDVRCVTVTSTINA